MVAAMDDELEDEISCLECAWDGTYEDLIFIDADGGGGYDFVLACPICESDEWLDDMMEAEGYDEPCFSCDGMGAEGDEDCSYCAGSGLMSDTLRAEMALYDSEYFDADCGCFKKKSDAEAVYVKGKMEGQDKSYFYNVGEEDNNNFTPNEIVPINNMKGLYGRDKLKMSIGAEAAEVRAVKHNYITPCVFCGTTDDSHDFLTVIDGDFVREDWKSKKDEASIPHSICADCADAYSAEHQTLSFMDWAKQEEASHLKKYGAETDNMDESIGLILIDNSGSVQSAGPCNPIQSSIAQVAKYAHESMRYHKIKPLVIEFGQSAKVLPKLTWNYIPLGEMGGTNPTAGIELAKEETQGSPIEKVLLITDGMFGWEAFKESCDGFCSNVEVVFISYDGDTVDIPFDSTREEVSKIMENANKSADRLSLGKRFGPPPSMAAEGKKNCGCGKDPCITYGADSIMDIAKDTDLGSFTSKELTESSAISGDFDHASLNYSGHQNIEARAEGESFGWAKPLGLIGGLAAGYISAKMIGKKE